MPRILTTVVALLAAPAAYAVDVTLHPGDDVAQLTGTLTAGDHYTFEDGTYDLTDVAYWVDGAGTEDQPIVFQAAEGAHPILRASGGWAVAYLGNSTYVEIRGLVFSHDETHYTEERAAGLVIEDSSNVTIEDIEVTHVGGTALSLNGNISAVTVRRAHVYDTRDGGGIHSGCGDASCWTQDSVIENCWVHDVRGDYSPGIYVENGGQGLQIIDNVVYQTGYGSIRTASTEFGTPNVIEGNVMWGGAVYGIAVSGAATVRNNIVFGIDGIGIDGDNNDRGTLENLVISHNTVVDTTDWGIRVQDWAATTGMVVANNAVSNPIGRAFWVGEDDIDETVYVGGNRFTGLVDAPTVDPTLGTYAPGGGYGDFQDVESWDFYPTASSELINAADPSSAAWVPDTDFNGVPRDGLSPDVGAYEYLGADNPGWILKEGFKDVGFVDNSGQDVGGCACQKNGGDDTEEAMLLAPFVLLAWGRRRRS